MKCLVTAGNTQALIDKVRCITNIFSGRTGSRIALELNRRGHDVVLLTSHPEIVNDVASSPIVENHWKMASYGSFEDLEKLLKHEVTQDHHDVIVHCAAVSDYLSAGVFVPTSDTHFDVKQRQWHADSGPPQLRDVSAGKVKSTHEELWLRFVKAPKLIDQIRSPWGFHGKLVKFKLEVGVDRKTLEAIAEASRLQSKADLMVANTLEGMNDWALFGPIDGGYVQVTRNDLANRLIDRLELT